MRKHEKLIEETSLKNNSSEYKESIDNNTQMNNTCLPLDSKINPNILTLIFRNQLSNDISISFEKTKIINISDIINILLSKLKVSKTESIIRLFFKGRPLQKDEKIEDISNYKNYFNIYSIN